MTYMHSTTPEGMQGAINQAKAASVVSPQFVFLADDKQHVIATGELPEDVLKRGGFLLYVNDEGRWVPRGSDDKMRDGCGACFDLPENLVTV